MGAQAPVGTAGGTAGQMTGDTAGKVADGAAGQAPFFSIVMPCYGVEAYIAAALACIEAQTEGSWELIVVDDATPDASARIAQDFAERDPRVRVVHHERNGGLSQARNTGLKEARGSYVWICDPDDTYDPDLLARARAALERTQADVCLFGFAEEYYDEHGAFMYRNELPLQPAEWPAAQDWRGMVIGWETSTHFGYAWNKMYRRSIIEREGLSYEGVRLIEDVLFNAAYFRAAEGVAIIGGTPYHYAKRRGRSLTNANAYGSREYFALHRRRIETLRELFVGWDVFDAPTRETLGALYGRFVLSALERSFYPAEGLTASERLAWAREVLDDPLSRELLPVAATQGSRVLAHSLSVLRRLDARQALRLAHLVYLVHTKAYGMFTRLRSGR